MKVLMYHYVSEGQHDLPYFTYLHRDDFAKQLTFLKREFGIVSKQRFIDWITCPGAGEAPSGVVLTFDDGFADHYLNVAPILADQGAWGIFYVPTGILAGEQVLDVHRIHLLLGHLGGAECASLLTKLSVASMFPDQARSDFSNHTYVRQHSSDELTKYVKRMLNYYADFKWRKELIDRLVAESGIAPAHWDELSECLYMTPKMVSDLDQEGHMIGSHSVTHRLLSKLTSREQRFEIGSSLAALSKLTRTPVKTFCYPYGGFHSFTSHTEELLSEAGVMFSFNVEQRDVTRSDLVDRPQALPRYDCNQFPYGTVSIGDQRGTQDL